MAAGQSQNGGPSCPDGLGDQGAGDRATPSTPPSRLRLCVGLAIVAAAALSAGWPTRHGEFLSGDDRHFVLEQVFVSHPSLGHACKLLTTVHGDLYQPVPMLTFQADYALAGRDPTGRFAVDPLVFHLTNIALHAVNAVLACLLAARLARCRTAGLLAGLMFACHPFALEPVAWISGRMILLATTFSLLLLLICLCRRDDGRGAWPAWAVVSWLFALASKVLPGVPIAAAVSDLYLRRRLPRRCWLVYGAIFLLTIAATWLAAQSSGLPQLMDSTQAETASSPMTRMVLAAGYYLRNYVWPSQLSPWSPPPKGVAFLSWQTAEAIGLFVCFLLAMCAAWRFNRVSLLGLGLFAILLGPFLAATVARRFLTADRYMYLPILGLHLAAAAVVVQAGQALARRVPKTLAAGLVGVPCLALPAAWTWASWQYAPSWSNTVAQAQRAVQVYPDDADAWSELARAHVFSKQPDDALRVIGQARHRWRDNPRLALQAGEAYRLKGELDRAEAELRCAAEEMPNHAQAQYAYALTLDDLGKSEEARAGYIRILRQHGQFLPAATALARHYLAAGQLDAAAGFLEQALAINPYHRDSLLDLGGVMMRRQQWDRAGEMFRRILDIDPTDQPAMLNLGAALSRSGRDAEAISAYDRLLEIDAAAVTARLNRAALFARAGRVNEAEADYRSVLMSEPTNRDAAVGLHECLQPQKRFEELVRLWLPFTQVGDGITDDGAEGRAWLVWAYVLAGQSAQASQTTAVIPEDGLGRDFADWALAFDALRRGDLDEFRRRLGEAKPRKSVTVRQREQAQSILMALADLPESVRESPPGLYALGRALAFKGDRDAARLALVRLTAMPQADHWTEAARRLAESLEEAATNQAVSPASRPSRER